MLAALCAMASVDARLAAQTPVCPPTAGAYNPSVLTGQYNNNRNANNPAESCLYSTAISAGTVTIAEASFSPLLVDSPPSSSPLAGACQCSLVQGSDGDIYGTAISGGPNNGGVIFALELGLPKPAPRAQHFGPASGAVGTRVLLWGSNLLSASVQFNGVAATAVSNSGSNYVLATVPPGATTGPITITTPGGTVTTKESFTVE
jgi:hypothetical protein